MANAPKYTGAGETVVVIDTGWSSAWATGKLLYQHDFLNNDADASVATANTHGALVTSEIVAKAPDVGVISLKVLPDDGSSTDMAVIERALQWVVANADAYNVVAVNLSLAGGSTGAPIPTALSDEFAALAAKRVLTSAAAGNAGDGGVTDGVSTFAADPNQICVSATTGTGQFPDWAQRSPTLTDLCADGTDVALTNLAGQTYLASGSSFAAPAVTAAIALAQDESVQLSGSRLGQDAFLSLAKSTGTPVGSTGYTELNSDALLAKIAEVHPPAPVAGTSTIVVNAQANVANGVGAHFNLLVDGVKVGEGMTSATARDYSFTTSAAAGAGHKVQVQYDNDTVGRDLIVNKVTVNGHAHTATESIVSYDKGALDGKDVVAGQSGMWWNGTLVVNAPAGDFAAPAPAASTIVVNAHGTPTGGVNAHFNLLVDGARVGEGTAGTDARDFGFTTDAPLGVGHKVQVQYDNDTSGRDLYIDKVTINGTAVAPTAPNVTYDKGALDGRDVVAGQSGLWWNGTLVIDADRSLFPGAATAMAAGGDATDLLAHALAPAHDAAPVGFAALDGTADPLLHGIAPDLLHVPLDLGTPA